jgi:ketosteroid isomerase-like protein
LRAFRSAALIAALAIAGCHSVQKENATPTPQQSEQAIAGLRAAYAAFNRGDIDGAVQLLDPQVEWTEPAEFPDGGTYHGIDGAKRYLAQSRAGAAQVISEPEQFISAGNRIVVFVHARVLPKIGAPWQDVHLADVYTFQNGRITQMRAFADRRDALRWVGIEQ